MTKQVRIEKLRAKMADEFLEGMLVSAPENRWYFSGFRGSAGYLWITPADAMLATDFRYTEQAGLQAPDYRVVRINQGFEWLVEAISDSGARRIGFEDAHLSVSTYQAALDAIKDLDPKRELIATGAMADQLRAVKDAEELAVMQQAILIADRAIETVGAALRPGMTEREVAWQVELHMREHDAEAISFDTIVAAGANGARPHHRPTDTKLVRGDAVVIDMGARYDGYCSDITRTFVLGDADEVFRRVYDTVLAAQETAEATARAGMTGADVDGLARDVIAEAGYGDNFGHSLGHGIGLAVHEYPRVGPNSGSQLIEDGMVFSVEPGIYLTGWGGVRIEDLVVMENGQPRVLTTAHKRDLVEL